MHKGFIMADFIDDFIQEYKSQPVLWQTSHPDFKNRKKRQDAYMKLIEVANKHNEAYNIERTKQKINNLRCAFRVQLKKYNEVKNNSKDGKEETYCPKRKYFESLMFLLNEETSTAKSIIVNKNKLLIKRSSLIRTRNKTLSRKKIDKELEAITLDLKEDLESDENFLPQSLESEKENKSKSDSYEDNEEAFNLALIEEEENLSVCNTKEIDPDAFESIIEEDDQSNKEMQSDFIKISKSSSPITLRGVSIAQLSNESIQKHKSPPISKPNVNRDLAEENIILLKSSPSSSSSSSVTITTPSSSTATTMATRAQFRQVQTKPTPTTPTTSQSNVAKFASLSHNKNTRIVQVQTLKGLIKSNNMHTVQSTPKQSQPQSQSLNSNPQKRLSTGLVTQTSSPSTITVSSIPSLTTSKPNVLSPIIAQKVVIPKLSTSGQQITIRNATNQITTKAITLPTTGITITTPQRKSIDEICKNNDTVESQTKKIKLDFDSSNLEKILSLACTKLKQEDNEDDFSVFGRMVTCKLKTMDTEQALIAQRLITEILFDGQMKLLQLPQQNSQKNNITTSNLQQLFSQSLHATPLTSLRHSTSGQTFYISDMNGNNTNIDSGSIQFSTNNSGGNVGASGNDC